jgi:hypothetical protein
MLIAAENIIHYSINRLRTQSRMRKQEVRTMKRFGYLSVLIVTLLALIVPSSALAAGATQFSGIAYWDVNGQCHDLEGFSYVVVLTGDLQGCHYTFVETATCSPSGAYNETGHEVFVGTYNGQAGTFGTTYRFTAKYNNCTDFLELQGRCQHPIVAGSGTGVFEGMTGRLDMWDNTVAGVALDFSYMGHLYPVSPKPTG